MKILKSIKFLFLSLILVFGGCDGDQEAISNIIKFDGGQFTLYRGYQYKYSDKIPGTGSTPFVVLLLGDGVSYDKNTSALSGIGSVMSFYMYSESEAEIKQGDYTIDIFSSKPVFSADSCEIFYNFDFDQDTGKYFDVNAGIFNVTNLGSVMSYEIDVVSDTLLFSGDFKGLIQTL